MPRKTKRKKKTLAEGRQSQKKTVCARRKNINIRPLRPLLRKKKRNPKNFQSYVLTAKSFAESEKNEEG